MTKRNCLDLLIVCPDLMCPKCRKPYQTWVWKDNLIFTCPECSEIGFSIEGISIKHGNLPKKSFYTDLDMPCNDDLDPSCTHKEKMLFIENYEELDFLQDHFKDSGSYNNYTQMQRSIGRAYELILDRITS